MVEASFNIFDIIVLSVIGLSALLSFFRGFMREFFSLGAWVGALVITLYSFPHVVEWLSPHVEDSKNNALIISGIAGVGTFMLSLICISLVTSMLTKLMKSGSDIGLLDNFLGLIFGSLRGLLLVTIGYMVAGIVMPKDGYEHYIANAKSTPYIQKSAAFLMSVAPEYVGDVTAVAEDGSIGTDKLPEESLKEGDDNSNQWDSMNELQRMIEEKAQDASDQYGPQ